jgi:nitric oxide reductase NorQ protein
MMSTPRVSLSPTARTLLRQRLREPGDGATKLLIQQAVEGSYGKHSISDLANGEILELAQRFNIAMPTAQEIADYVPRRGAGANQDDDQGEPAQDLAPVVQAVQAQAEVTEPDPIEAEVSAVLQPLGAGDFPTFQALLLDLATRANKPAEVIQVQGATRALVGARKKIGTKTAANLGLAMGNVSKRDLPVYDAPGVIDPHFVWHKDTPAALAAIARGRNLFLTGPMGSGKTTWAEQLAAHLGRDFVRISCDDQTEAAQLVGMTLGKDEQHAGVWQDGQLTKAIRRPGTVILLDEPSVARPGALFVMQSVLDGDRTLHIAETGEAVRVADDVIFVAADNTNGTGDASGQYEGTRVLNRAFLDRFAMVIQFDYLAPADEALLLTNRTGCDPALANQLCKVAALTRTKADNGHLSHGLGLRRLVSLAESMTDGMAPVAAFQASVINAVPFDDREALRQIWSTDFKWSK